MEETASSTLFESIDSCRIRRIPRLGNFDCANTIPQSTGIAFKQAHATPIRGESQARHRNFCDWSGPLFTPQQLLFRRAIVNIDTFPSIFARLERSCLVYPFKLGQQLSWKSTEFQKETESYRGILLRLENHIESHVWNPGACGEWQCARSCQT